MPSPELVFLVAMARARPLGHHVAVANDLVRREFSSSRLFSLAARNNVIPLLSARLHEPGAPAVSKELLERLREAATPIRRMSALLFGRQLMLIERVLLPRGIAFSMIKGASLSHQHYGDPLLRHSRDIDLLIDPDRLAEVASVLVEQGWSIVNPSWQAQKIDAFARFSSVIELRSAEGVRVELHRTLDSGGMVFDTRRLLDRTRRLEISGRSLPVLADDDQFEYMCFHHGRHRWACFAWCADLLAMIDAANVEFGSRGPLKRSMMAKTLGASIKLARDLDRIASGQPVQKIAEPSPFLMICLESIDRETPPDAVATVIDPGDMEPDFPFRWQHTWRYRWRYQLNRLHPNLNDYDAFPVSRRHMWLLWALRPVRAIMRRVSKRASRWLALGLARLAVRLDRA